MKYIPTITAFLSFMSMVSAIYNHQMDNAGAWASACLGWIVVAIRVLREEE